MLKVTLVKNHLFYYLKLLCEGNIEKYLSVGGKELILDFLFLLEKKMCNYVKFSGKVRLVACISLRICCQD